MPKNNPANPFSRDEGATKREVPMPISRAKVISAPTSEEGGLHTVRIRVYGDNAPYDAPVLPLTLGSAYVPQKGDDVAVLFGADDVPWVVGPWYASDRVNDGDAEMPQYEPGELVLGNHTDAKVRWDNYGNLLLEDEDKTVVVEEQIGNPLCIPHTEWSDALTAEEIWRVNLDPDERLKAYRLNIAPKGGASADLRIDLYDEDNGEVLAEASGLATGQPLAESEAGVTVLARITNNTSELQKASIDSKLSIERTVE